MARGVIKLAALAGIAKQVRDYARKNPDSVSSTIGRVETAVSRKVGPKYADHVGKGGQALRSGLGIPSGGTSPGSGPAAPGTTPPPPAPGTTPPPPAPGTTPPPPAPGTTPPA